MEASRRRESLKPGLPHRQGPAAKAGGRPGWEGAEVLLGQHGDHGRLLACARRHRDRWLTRRCVGWNQSTQRHPMSTFWDLKHRLADAVNAHDMQGVLAC